MDSVTQKYCHACDSWKSLDEFGRNKSKKDGRATECKQCHTKQASRYHRNNIEEIKEKRKRLYHENPEKYRKEKRDSYWRHPEQRRKDSSEWAKANPERVKERRRQQYRADVAGHIRKTVEWVSKNIEKAREYKKRWARNHPEKVREIRIKEFIKDPEKSRARTRNRRAKRKGNGGKITLAEWREVLDKYGHKCLYPGCERTDVTMDHVVPIALGGKHEKGNVQPLCKSHNSSKGTKILDYRK